MRYFFLAFDWFGKRNDWLTCLGDVCLPFCSPRNIDTKATKESYEKFWARRVDRNTLLFLILIVTLTTMNMTSILQNWNWSKNQCIGDHPTRCKKEARNGWFRFYGPMLVPQIQLMIIVSLCLDNGKSWTGRILNMRLFQFLGRISMSLYLIYGNVLFCVNTMLYYSWTDVKKSNSFLKNIGNVPIAVILSLIAATILTVIIDEPVNRYLTKKLLKKEKKE